MSLGTYDAAAGCKGLRMHVEPWLQFVSGRQTGANRKIESGLLCDIYEPTESWKFAEAVAGFWGLSEYGLK